MIASMVLTLKLLKRKKKKKIETEDKIGKKDFDDLDF